MMVMPFQAQHLADLKLQPLQMSLTDWMTDEKAAFQRDPELIHQLRRDISRLFAEGFSNAVVNADSPQMKMIEDVCRENLESSVTDPQLREKLRPDYRAACKRLVISADFYQAIQKPNAALVTEGVERIEGGGVRTRDGHLHELDVLPPQPQRNDDRCPRKEGQKQTVDAPCFRGVDRSVRRCPTGKPHADDKDQGHVEGKHGEFHG